MSALAFAFCSSTRPRALGALLLLSVFCVLSALSACSEPGCHPNEIKVGDVCKRRYRDGGAEAADASAASICDAASCEQRAVVECDATKLCAQGFTCRAGQCRYVPPVRSPSQLSQTSGSASSSSSRYQLRWSVGAAAPQGQASSQRHQLRAGPPGTKIP